MVSGARLRPQSFSYRRSFRGLTVSLVRPNDNFLRQVHWILWSIVTETALIITPEEAEHFMPLIRDAKVPPTHLLAYADPVTRKMLHFNSLTYYAMPTLQTGWKPPTRLTIELGIFAGRLYFDFDEYSDLCKYLGFEKVPETSDNAVPSFELQETNETTHGAANEAEMDTST
ncbi:hypothetical protein BJ546DRAFT_147139 [Cryomyces antarcticus]